MTSAESSVKYATKVAEWLRDEGYTHCFFVAGGNIMHLLDGMRTTMTCIPTVHEVSAGIATEYFNEAGGEGRAFALVTAGPGLTNIITAAGGAWLESRELLVLGGQVKSEDLMSGGVRQRGIQEIDGVSIMRPVTKVSELVREPWPRSRFLDAVRAGRRDRPGPVFLEFCLDAQGAPVLASAVDDDIESVRPIGPSSEALATAEEAADLITALTLGARRPVWMIGGGVSRTCADSLHDDLVGLGVPVVTTWNGADRLHRDDEVYVGRPNTWGQRSANMIVDLADLVVVFGSRLGMQQTGFNWQEWARNATVVQIDIDPAELRKGHPRVDHAFAADADATLTGAVRRLNSSRWHCDRAWLAHCREVRTLLPRAEAANETGVGFVDPYQFCLELEEVTNPGDIVIPCSSGGANSVPMQVFEPQQGQLLITDKGLASMGYGLAGAIGAALAHRGRRTLLIEGDGGFSQNIQELATVAVNHLPLKIFIFANNGYGSIRTTQRNYFGGAYLGCDVQTGLGFPDWPTLFDAYGIPCRTIAPDWRVDPSVNELLEDPGPAAFIVPIDPDQTYWPKITSRVTESGSMESNPLHAMSPDLDEETLRAIRNVPGE